MIKETEQWFIDQVKAIFASRLKGVESLPANLDAKSFERMLLLAPGVFVVFSGGDPQKKGTTTPNILSRWVLFAATGNAGGQQARRHGDATEIGAYEICERLAALLHGRTVPDVGTLALAGIHNLFSEGLDLEGLTVYGVDFDLPMTLDPSDYSDPSSLDDFLSFKDTWTPTQGDGGTPAHDDVELPPP